MATSASNLNLNQSNATSGNGIDVTAVVNQILYADRAPEKLWQQQQSTLQVQAAVLNSINSSLSSLQDKVNSLKDLAGPLASKTATSSESQILTATVQPSAWDGTHIVVVSNLASTGTAYSDPLADSGTSFQTGTISLNIGSKSVDIQIDGTNNTLDTLASYINQQNLGISASVVNDASGARLALVSQATGSAGDLTITGNSSGLGMHKGATGQNASLTIDGVPFSSATNTVTGAIPGVTLRLASSAPNTEVQLSVGEDQAGAKHAVSDFVSSYNQVINAINAQYTVTSGGQTGPLAADSSLRELQSSLLSNAAYSLKGNSYVNLASLGVNMADDGTLSVDETQLDSALSGNYSDFQNFFQTASTGFAAHFSTSLNALTDSTQGLLNVDLTQNASQQKALSQQISDLEDRLAVQQQQLIQQYSQVDTALRMFPTIMAQLNSELSSLSSL